MLLLRHTQAVTHGVRVETEDLTDALERVRPGGILGADPLRDLAEEPSASMVGGAAIFLDAIDRVLDDGDHEASLRCQWPDSFEVLRR